MSRKLVMKFTRDNGKVYTLSLNNLNSSANEEEVKDIKDMILNNNIILPDGKKMQSFRGAEIIESNKRILEIK